MKCMKFLFALTLSLTFNDSLAMEDKASESRPLLQSVRGSTGGPKQETMGRGPISSQTVDGEACYQAALKFLQSKGIRQDFTEEQIYGHDVELISYLSAAEKKHIAATDMLIRAMSINGKRFLLTTHEFTSPEDLLIQWKKEVALGRRAALSKLVEDLLPWLIDNPGVDAGAKLFYQRKMEYLTTRIEMIDGLLARGCCKTCCCGGLR